ncbi:MAG: glycine zipper 2TM domain-containing protein [Alphaproteobacteria bacterium]
MKKIVFALLLACTLAACGIGNTNTTYERYNVGQQGTVSYGTIINMSVVNTAGTSSVGTIGGAVAGGAAGSMIGGNTAVNIIGGVGGAILGGMIGNAAESAITKDTAIEFIVQKQNGQIVSVVQSNELNLRVGDYVMLITTDGTTRIRMRMQ